ncbi:hypothetical protein LAZ67_18001630 [Cordylochernes scorpioides]|uniref:Uncharacterized protein n=1 Tax=Cordylochernes scorpioides TaxID=51811 RepID=A0ABY6LFV9_9ARAC|nr:hypothetical protein LAZ67_18001630 [Cordylochernes scorpioides]
MWGNKQLSGKRTPLPKEQFGSAIRCCPLQGGSSTVYVPREASLSLFIHQNNALCSSPWISTEDEHRPGRPVESVTQENIDKIHDLVMLNRRMTVRHIEETLGIPKTTVSRIMRKHMGLRKLSARWVPKLLTPDQKAIRRKLS